MGSFRPKLDQEGAFSFYIQYVYFWLFEQVAS